VKRRRASLDACCCCSLASILSRISVDRAPEPSVDSRPRSRPPSRRANSKDALVIACFATTRRLLGAFCLAATIASSFADLMPPIVVSMVAICAAGDPDEEETRRGRLARVGSQIYGAVDLTLTLSGLSSIESPSDPLLLLRVASVPPTRGPPARFAGRETRFPPPTISPLEHSPSEPATRCPSTSSADIGCHRAPGDRAVTDATTA
jgi:hypothetical protein